MEKTDIFSATYPFILDRIKEGESILDLGCGEGDLMKLLQEQKRCRVQGIEIDSSLVHKCVEKGLFVYNGDIDEGLADLGNKRFDTVILSNVIQSVQKPETTLLEALRVGKQVIVSFTNFGNINVRLQLLFTGRMPKTKELPYEWYNTPNIHLSTVQDFIHFCKERDIKVKEEIYLVRNSSKSLRNLHIMPNIRGNVAMFVLAKD